MANIRVKCPACKTELEIDADHEGQEVECGNCLEVFKATRVSAPSASSSDEAPPPKSQKKRRDDDEDEEEKPRKKKKRRRDDDDDDDDYYPPPRRSGGSNGLAITSLILGITAFFPGCCCYLFIPLSLGAIITGSIGMKNQQGKGMAIAGIVLGVCALFLYGGLIVLGHSLNMNNMNGRFR
jgi:predicted Zn finger-like uncharacterized protein